MEETTPPRAKMSNIMKAGTKTTFDVAAVIAPIYNGGAVSVSEDGQVLATVLGEEVILSSLTTGKVLARIEGDGEQVTTIAYTGSHIAVCSRSMSMRLYALQPSDDLDETIEPKLLRTVKPHAAPVVTSAVDSTGSLLATGGVGLVQAQSCRNSRFTRFGGEELGLLSRTEATAFWQQR